LGGTTTRSDREEGSTHPQRGLRRVGRDAQKR
jgi:hypothetical protein